jgi:CheY-like chemotaxis protein/anti-sigma regulatory factor (Ser/Thr protein kinase)
LNNILGAVLGQAELMRLHTTDPVILGALQLLCTAASDGARVLRRIQAFARRQSGEPHIPCDLATLVNEALDLTRPFWQDEAQRQRRPIQIWTALEGLPLVLGNPVEIREALTNLILNAADAMPTGGSLTIAGSSATGSGIRGAGEEVLITIRDTGIGMSQEVCQRIFEPFFTTKGPRGTGLGLALVYEIMDRHGGTIDVTSTLGRGTTFTLRFQAAQETRAPREEAAQPLVPLSRRLLVIDDEPNVRHTITAMLRVAGHTVFEAENGPEGLVVLAESPVDLVLTDLGMPGMTGWELAQKIKATHPQLPVVLLTGWDHPDPAGTLEQTGVDRVLAKPVRLEDLQVAIMECTSGKP